MERRKLTAVRGGNPSRRRASKWDARMSVVGYKRKSGPCCRHVCFAPNFGLRRALRAQVFRRGEMRGPKFSGCDQSGVMRLRSGPAGGGTGVSRPAGHVGQGRGLVSSLVGSPCLGRPPLNRRPPPLGLVIGRFSLSGQAKPRRSGAPVPEPGVCARPAVT